MSSQTETRDLNDVFDAIVCLESTTLDEGYAEGVKEGRQESGVDGFVIGINTARSLSFDLGYAKAFCCTILEPKTHSNIVTLCNEVIDNVTSFPIKNLEHDDMLAKAGGIKSQLDRIKDILKKKHSDDSTAQQFSI